MGTFGSMRMSSAVPAGSWRLTVPTWLPADRSKPPDHDGDIRNCSSLYKARSAAACRGVMSTPIGVSFSRRRITRPAAASSAIVAPDAAQQVAVPGPQFGARPLVEVVLVQQGHDAVAPGALHLRRGYARPH